MTSILKDPNNSINTINSNLLKVFESTSAKSSFAYEHPIQNKENNKINDNTKNSFKNKTNLKNPNKQSRKSSCNLKNSYNIQKYDPNISKLLEKNTNTKRNIKVTFSNNNQNFSKTDKKNEFKNDIENDIREKIKGKSAKCKQRRLSSGENSEKIIVNHPPEKRKSNFVGYNNTNKRTNITKSLENNKSFQNNQYEIKINFNDNVININEINDKKNDLKGIECNGINSLKKSMNNLNFVNKFVTKPYQTNEPERLEKNFKIDEPEKKFVNVIKIKNDSFEIKSVTNKNDEIIMIRDELIQKTKDLDIKNKLINELMQIIENQKRDIDNLKINNNNLLKDNNYYKNENSNHKKEINNLKNKLEKVKNNNISSNINPEIFVNKLPDLHSNDKKFNTISASTNNNTSNNRIKIIPNSIFNNISNKIPNNISNNISSNIPNNNSSDVSCNISKDISNNISKNITKDISNDISNNISKKISKDIPNNLTNRNPKDIFNNISNRNSKDIPNNLTNRNPKDISNNLTNNVSNNTSNNISKNITNNISNSISSNITNSTSNSKIINNNKFGQCIDLKQSTDIITNNSKFNNINNNEVQNNIIKVNKNNINNNANNIAVINKNNNEDVDKKSKMESKMSKALKRIRRQAKSVEIEKAVKSDKITNIAQLLEQQLDKKEVEENSINVKQEEVIMQNEDVINLIDRKPTIKKRKKIRNRSFDG